jgi:phage N-6-adenine-methyltransferase
MAAEQLGLIPGVDVRPKRWTTDHWATPWPIFDAIAREFGPFHLDACAEAHNTKCDRFFSPEDDGLERQWFGRVWCNPPYSQKEPWLAKARRAVDVELAELVACIVPARVEAGWWHRQVEGAALVRFLPGRIRFIGADGTTSGRPLFATALVVYRRAEHLG